MAFCVPLGVHKRRRRAFQRRKNAASDVRPCCGGWRSAPRPPDHLAITGFCPGGTAGGRTSQVGKCPRVSRERHSGGVFRSGSVGRSKGGPFHDEGGVKPCAGKRRSRGPRTIGALGLPVFFALGASVDTSSRALFLRRCIIGSTRERTLLPMRCTVRVHGLQK